MYLVAFGSQSAIALGYALACSGSLRKHAACPALCAGVYWLLSPRKKCDVVPEPRLHETRGGKMFRRKGNQILR